MNINDMVRLQILSDVLSNMSEEDRRTYIMLSSQKEEHGKIQQDLFNQGEKLDELIRRTSWTKSFLSDVGANVITNAAFLLIAKLFK